MASRTIDLSLILACYNEGPTLIQSLEKIREVLDNSLYRWEIICIDDKSKDKTANLLREFAREEKRVKVFFHQRNVGRGGTVIEGIRKARGRVVGFIDVDLEVAPVYIPEFVREIDKGSDMIIARRIYKEELVAIPRWVASRSYVLIVRHILKLDFEDTEAGYKFFNRKKILPVLKKVKDKKWFFDTEVVARSCWAGLKINTIPVLFLRRPDKQSTVRIIPDTLEYLKQVSQFRKEVLTHQLPGKEEEIFLPSRKDYLAHLLKYGHYIKPAEIVDWCSRISSFRTLRVVRTLKDYKDRTAKVLDLGCGTGLNTPSLARAFPKTIACDLDPKLAVATKSFLSRFKIKIPVVVYNGKELPFKKDSFDAVACIEVFEHAKNPDLLLREIRRVLKKDGLAYLTAPNKLWPIESHYHLPFLSYLPQKWANWYVRLFKKGKAYENIYLLPTYQQFSQMVGKYFEIEDITFETIIDYQRFDLDKERGSWIKILAWFLKLVQGIGPLKFLLLNLSAGWLLIIRPKE